MIREEQLQEWRDMLKKEQERLEPHLTIERMGELMNRDKGGALYVLRKMEERGMVKAVRFGSRKRYRIV